MIEKMLLGSILTNIEVAYNLTLSEGEKLEKSQEIALRKSLKPTKQILQTNAIFSNMINTCQLDS